MSSTKCISANVQKPNGAMTIVQAGAVSSSDASKQDLSLSEITQPQVRVFYASHVKEAVSAVSSGNLGTIRPYNAGTFAYLNSRQFVVPIIGRYISGVATNLFLNPSSKISQRPNNKLGAIHTAYLTALSWTGGYDGLPHYSATVASSAPSFGADHATLEPAEFCMRTGKPTVDQNDYQAQYSV